MKKPIIDHPVVVCVLSALSIGAVILLLLTPAIHKWERDNGYPFGYLCEVYQNCNPQTEINRRWP